MILFFIYTFLKKYSNQGWKQSTFKISRNFKGNIHNFLLSLFIILMLLMPVFSNAQYIQLNYKITRNGDEIGWLRIEKTTKGNTSDLLLVSEIKTKIVFPITVFVKESSTFERGKLVYSSQIRKTNGTLNLEKQTRLVANEYEVLENGARQELSFTSIGTNLQCLYFDEPVNLKSVYCDNQKCFVKVGKTTDGGYNVKFPNGNTNSYYYKEGVCTKIKILHTFYSVEIIFDPLFNSYANNK